MTKILVSGCSFTYGQGLNNTINDKKLWVNQLLSKSFDNPDIVNIAETGINNHQIFTETASELIKSSYDIAIVGWTNVARYNYPVGLELYKTISMLNSDALDVNINPNVNVSGKWLNKLGDQLRRYSNDHWSLLNLVKYVNILYNLQVINKKSKIFFVNSLIKIPNNYFSYKDFSTPAELDVYTQELLQVETRDDIEIKKLYNMIHSQYHQYGGIQENCWLNLYNSFNDMKIDTISNTDKHPGYQSQDIFVDYLLPIFQEKIK